MDKKKQVMFNLNNFLLSISSGLDSIESDIYYTSSSHSKRIAFIALKLAQEFNYEAKGVSDVCSYALLHNIGLKETKEKNKSYCEIGQRYAKQFPFLLKDEQDIIKYHCEYYDGSGVYGLKADEIPLFSQFISFVDIIDTKFDLSKKDIGNRTKISEFLSKNENKLFSTDMVECFNEFSQKESFWLDLQNESEMLTYIFTNIQDFSSPLDFEEVLKLTSIFHKMINKNDKIIINSSKMADFYNFEHKDKYTFLIASTLINIGKLYITNNVLEKESSLKEDEYIQIKSYPYYTKKTLSNIMGFNDICSWASKAQEFINGTGYPYNLEGKDLSLKDRLLTTINIYTSLTSEKPYRKAFNTDESFKILDSLSNEGKLDKAIVEDMKKVFS